MRRNNKTITSRNSRAYIGTNYNRKLVVVQRGLYLVLQAVKHK